MSHTIKNKQKMILRSKRIRGQFEALERILDEGRDCSAVGNHGAISCTARRNLVFDLGFEKGLTSTSTRWESFAGMTYLLPHRLW
jgi:hypothetical protein